MKTQSLIFGHSHVWSINRAIESKTYAPKLNDYEAKVLLCGTQAFPDDIVLCNRKGEERLNPCLVAALHPYNPADPDCENVLVSVVQGNYYNMVALVEEKGKSFDFIVPGHEELPMSDNIEIIPYAAISETIAEKAASFPPYIKMLKSLGYKTAIHVGAPPPIEDSSIILDEVIKRTGPNDDFKIVDPNVRLKLWIAQNAFIRANCKRHGVTYLEAPKSTINKSGFMKPEFIKDSVHGNFKYSTIVLEEIDAFLSEKET